MSCYFFHMQNIEGPLTRQKAQCTIIMDASATVIRSVAGLSRWCIQARLWWSHPHSPCSRAWASRRPPPPRDLQVVVGPAQSHSWLAVHWPHTA